MKIFIKEQLSEHKYRTPQGYLVCTDAIIARTGKQTYKKSNFFPNAADADEDFDVDRKEEDVFSPETMASFENVSVTIDHPSEEVTSENDKELSVGFVRDVRKGEENGKPVMLANLVIKDEEAIRLIESGEMKELSCGYDCDVLDENNPCQTNIRGNHVALCRQGRAGNARILDSVKDTNVKDTARTVTVQCYIMDDNNHILTQMRTGPVWPGLAVPGGHVKVDESPVDACIREVLEETGLHVRQLELFGTHLYTCDEDGESIALLYRTKDFYGELHSSKEGEVKWMDIDFVLADLDCAEGFRDLLVHACQTNSQTNDSKIEDAKFYVGISKWDYTKEQAEEDARRYGLKLQITGKSRDPNIEFDGYLIGPRDKIIKMLKANNMEEFVEEIKDSSDKRKFSITYRKDGRVKTFICEADDAEDARNQLDEFDDFDKIESIHVVDSVNDNCVKDYRFGLEIGDIVTSDRTQGLFRVVGFEDDKKYGHDIYIILDKLDETTKKPIRRITMWLDGGIKKVKDSVNDDNISVITREIDRLADNDYLSYDIYKAIRTNYPDLTVNEMKEALSRSKYTSLKGVNLTWLKELKFKDSLTNDENSFINLPASYREEARAKGLAIEDYGSQIRVWGPRWKLEAWVKQHDNDDYISYAKIRDSVKVNDVFGELVRKYGDKVLALLPDGKVKYHDEKTVREIANKLGIEYYNALDTIAGLIQRGKLIDISKDKAYRDVNKDSVKDAQKSFDSAQKAIKVVKLIKH